MILSTEVIVISLINLLSLGVTIGMFVGKTNLVIHRLAILEAKQDKYNNMQERIIRAELSVNSAHKRIDHIQNKDTAVVKI
ncbi:MAG: hypothetical protein FWC85_01080 [Elusimicrobia bacterium]|nr:hypothetical protein [Elusimicrobiota bacterium]